MKKSKEKIKFDLCRYDDMEHIVTDYVPLDIDGDKIYKIGCDKDEWLE